MKGVKGFFQSLGRTLVRIRQRNFIRKLLRVYKQQQVVDRYLEAVSPTVPIGKDAPIWLCWWQGESEMPEVVKACYRSIQQHACQHPVILITTENQREYLHLPDFIWQKFEEGKISRTHLSDVARMYLLKERGGIWMDVTNFLTTDIDDFVDMAQPYWSCRHITYNKNVSGGYWTSFFLACGRGHIVPSYIYDSLVHYWHENDQIIDYLLMDYFFRIGYDSVPALKAAVDAVPLSVIGTLRKALHRPYDAAEWEKYCRQAGFQKLSYKKYLDKVTRQGEKTLFAHFLELYLPDTAGKY